MANIFLTDQCDRGCKFCFAKIGPWSKSYPSRALTLAEVREILEVKAFSPQQVLGVVGGEPLSYPHLFEVMEMMKQKRIVTKIFTSGSCTPADGLERYKEQMPLNFIVNIDSMDSYTPERRKNLERFLKTFGPITCVGFTLVDPERDLSFLLDYIRDYRMLRYIRMGVALPIAGLTENEYIRRERYRDAGLRFMELARKAAAENISIGCDCGFVACMFEISEIGQLQRWGMKIQFVCGPAMDIGPELETWHCFPLSRMPRVSLRKYQSFERVRMALQSMADQLREKHGPGIFTRCRECRYRKRGQCSGGCLGLIVPENALSEVEPKIDSAVSTGESSCPISC
jgi:MoaA/NifB/PqqE/SkfB family radical SAM enzyme